MIQYINIYPNGGVFYYEHRGYSRPLKAKSYIEAEKEIKTFWKGSEPIRCFYCGEPITNKSR